MASIIGVETLQHTNGTTAATIDSSGRILTPSRPAFKAYKGTGGSITYAGGAVVSADMDTTEFNQGGHYSTSTGIFTAPVDGLYHFGTTLFNNSTSEQRCSISVTPHGVSNRFAGQGQSSQYNDFSVSGIIELTSGNTVYVTTSYSSTIIYQGESHSYFWGYLVG